jgi:LysM repeat protein
MGRVGLVDRRSAARIAAPLAFLAAVTVAVLLIRSGMDEAATRENTVPVATAPAPPASATSQSRRFYRIRPGDTLAAIAPRFGLTEVELLALNPGIEPTALRIGQRIRVR